MPTIIATRELRYAGRTVAAGEAFDALDRDAKLLVAIKKASYAPSVNSVDLPPAVAPQAEADEPTTEEPEIPFEAPKPRRGRPPKGYSRRDMRVED